ncbi:MAG TPA: helix-turn-helix domain-containing protein, partial [Verrucomicrobiae bacterium]|nr:helix-turn-helix domain-containing protein [Verrucomicrobiae bacterium]
MLEVQLDIKPKAACSLIAKVRTWVLPLMKRIYAGDYPTKAGRILGLSRSHVWYYVCKLEKAGLVYQEKRSNAAFYALTTEGSNLL